MFKLEDLEAQYEEAEALTEDYRNHLPIPEAGHLAINVICYMVEQDR